MVLHLVRSSRDGGYDLLRASGSTSFEITHETICCLYFCGSMGAWQEVRFVASSFCGCVGAWQEVRFVASSFCGSVELGKKYALLPLVLWLGRDMARSTICCFLFYGSVGAWQEVRFVASSFCGCVGAWQEVRFAASSFEVLLGHDKKYDFWPLVSAVA